MEVILASKACNCHTHSGKRTVEQWQRPANGRRDNCTKRRCGPYRGENVREAHQPADGPFEHMLSPLAPLRAELPRDDRISELGLANQVLGGDYLLAIDRGELTYLFECVWGATGGDLRRGQRSRHDQR